MNRVSWPSALFLLLVAVGSIVGGAASARKAKTPPYAPKIDPARFVARVDHPYFPLLPGTRWVYRETIGNKTSVDEMTVMPETRLVQGVTCTVVHDILKHGEDVVEDTMDWYAQDDVGNVWYFGEDTKEYFPHGRVSTEGSWEAGTKGCQPGIIMLAQPARGEPYRQEYGRGVAEDMGQVVELRMAVSVPYGTFEDCVKTKDWSMLEAGHEFKWYAKGIGFVRSESSSKEVSELVSFTHP